MASSGDITKALELQLNVPHFDISQLQKNGELKEVLGKIPFDLMKECSVIPVNKEKNVLSLVMLNPKDFESIDKIRGFTGCSVTPFFVLENEFNQIWEKVIKKADKGQ